MNKISFIHLSDIHLIKSSNDPADIDKDIRDAILTDLKININNQLVNLSGVLLCGDIAFSGVEVEYNNALMFLRDVTNVIGLKESDVFCVPGNHDVNKSIPIQSKIVGDAQEKIENAKNVDDADKNFKQSIEDICCNDALFKHTDKYNDFASRYDCNTSPKSLNWKYRFSLDYNINLCVWGINSCFISKGNDNDEKCMYVGQAQIPPLTDIVNTIYMTLCHHPKELWKFQDIISEKFDKRADIQLFGHFHTQKISLTDNNVILNSGAVQPVRGEDWIPRYNWISIEIIKEVDERKIIVNIFPRKLSNDRNRFAPDWELCAKNSKSVEPSIFIEHVINIDKKRKNDFSDEIYCKQKQKEVFADIIPNPKINQRELIYKFLNLSYVKQTKILAELNLLDDCDEDKRYATIMKKIIDKATKCNLLNKFLEKIILIK